MVYFDYSATTPVDPKVKKAMLPYFDEKYGNPSSIHKFGRDANKAIAEAKEMVSSVLNCNKGEIIFTGSATESINLAIQGVARANSQNKRKRILFSEIEHKAVINTARALSDTGYDFEAIPVDQKGIVDVEQIRKEVKKGDVLMLSVIYANNEIGTIQPIDEISRIAKDNNAIFHTDACQAANYLSLDVKELGVDLMTLNGSKLYAPKGIGLLYISDDVEIKPIIFGGGQQKGLRSGTENVAGIVGIAKAIEIAEKTRSSESTRQRALRDRLIDGLLMIPDSRLNGSRAQRLPNNVNISFGKIEGESLVLELDKMGIAVSTGSACAAGGHEPSHVIGALYKGSSEKNEIAHSSIRYSIGKDTRANQIDLAINATKRAVRKLRNISAIR